MIWRDRQMRGVLPILLFVGMTSSIASAALLSREQYLATFAGPNKKIDAASYDTSQAWKYMRTVPKSDYRGYEICWGYVPFVYRTADSRFDHVYVSTRTQNVFLIVVKTNASGNIYGHHLLDLNEQYGLGKPRQLTRKCLSAEEVS